MNVLSDARCTEKSTKAIAIKFAGYKFDWLSRFAINGFLGRIDFQLYSK